MQIKSFYFPAFHVQNFHQEMPPSLAELLAEKTLGP